jgi:cell division septation protein DedD
MKLSKIFDFFIDRIASVSKPKLFIIAFVGTVGGFIAFKKLIHKNPPVNLSYQVEQNQAALNVEQIPADSSGVEVVEGTQVAQPEQSNQVVNPTTVDASVAAVNNANTAKPNTSVSTTEDKTVTAKTKTIDQFAPEEVKNKVKKEAPQQVQSSQNDSSSKVQNTGQKQSIEKIIEKNSTNDAIKASPSLSKYYKVQIGAFSNKNAANSLVKKASQLNKNKEVKVFLEKKLVKKQIFYVVQLGLFKSEDKAKTFCKQAKSSKLTTSCLISK